MSFVYTYSARPDEFVSQMPWLPDSVFRSVAPEAAGPEAAEADADGARLVVVAPAAGAELLLDALLQAAANTAMEASVRPRPDLRTKVLQSMKILPWERADQPTART